jgi:hypothetical protein
MWQNGSNLFLVGELVVYIYDPLKCGDLLHIAPEKFGLSYIYIYGERTGDLVNEDLL